MMSKFVKHLGPNPSGKDFAVGDIHGCFSRMEEGLNAIGFDPSRDRLFSVGDLVDRGPESHRVLDWLAKPWFHAIQGNHEEMAITWGHLGANPHEYERHGGKWLMDMRHDEQQPYVEALAKLPYAMEVETATGLVGLVHAEVSQPTWQSMREKMHDGATDEEMEAVKNHILWSQSRYRKRHAFEPIVPDLKAVVVGHVPMVKALVLGNAYYLDTCGWVPKGHFTFLNLGTLEIMPATP